MIRNDNKIGNYWVLVYAKRNSIASFECPTLDDVAIEVARIVAERVARGLPTTKAIARQVIARQPKRGNVWAAPITINMVASTDSGDSDDTKHGQAS